MYMVQPWQVRVCVAIGFTVLATNNLGFAGSGLAQVVPDNSLGIEASRVTPNVMVGGQTAELIEGGARRGANLFHSFQEFNVGNFHRFLFANPIGVENILTRVIGPNPSNILGTLGVSGGNANLFLMNPNGIVFGRNARLQLSGSFVATTANAIGFPNGEIFSSNPAQRLPNQLLTVNPNALFFNQSISQSITNQSNADNAGLNVQPGKNLLLVGGLVQLESGKLISSGSYVELAAIGGLGQVDLSTIQEDWQLNIPDGMMRADITLRNGGDINVQGSSGSIRILAQNIDISRSSLRIEIPEESRLPDTQTGDLELNATGSITISDSSLANSLFGQGTIGSINLTAGDRILLDDSLVFNTLETRGLGTVGDINITTGALFVTNIAQLISTSNGRGNAGNVIINARDRVLLSGRSADGEFGSAAFSRVEQGAEGHSGNVQINTKILEVLNGAFLTAEMLGKGNAGNVIINARDRAVFNNGDAFSSVEQGAEGNGGNVQIDTNVLEVLNGAQLIASTAGKGNAGNVIIKARDRVVFSGSSADGEFRSAAFSRVEQGGEGQGGNIQIDTNVLQVLNGAQLIANTRGVGNAGNVQLQANSLQLTNGARINAGTSGIGDGGQVAINVRDTVSLDGFDNELPTSILSNVEEGARGNVNGVRITAGSLSVTNRALLESRTRGTGNAGNIDINVRGGVVFSRSGAYSSIEPNAIGRGGDINITAGRVSLFDGAALETSIKGTGNGGNINIQGQALTLESNAALIGDVGVGGKGKGGDITLTIDGTIAIVGGNIAPTGESTRITLGVQPFGTGDSGDLQIRANALVLQDGGLIKVSTQGQGNAGQVFIDTETVTISGSVPSSGLPSGIFTSSDTSGNAGDMTIGTQFFRIADGAALSARTRAQGQGGDITVNARSFEAINGGQLITTTSGQGRAGNITVNTTEQVTIAGSDSNYTVRLSKFPKLISPFVANAIRETGAASGLYANTEPDSVGPGGDIRITTRQLNLIDGVEVSASTKGTGIAGAIGISTQTFSLSGGARVTTNTFGNGQAGNLAVNVKERLFLTGQGTGLFASTAPGSTGNGGSITIDPQLGRIEDGAAIAVDSQGSGTGGNISIRADRLELDRQGNITAETASAQGGNITLDVNDLLVLRRNSLISATAGNAQTGGDGGNIIIRTPFIVSVLSENSDITANAFTGRGGNINIFTNAIYGLLFQPRLTPFSDITASSQFGISGTVTIQTLGLDPSRGLTTLPTDLADPSQLIAATCPADEGSSFAITGRGGLPEDPRQPLMGTVIWQDERGEVKDRENRRMAEAESKKEAGIGARRNSEALVEAQGWIVDRSNTVVLVARPFPQSAQWRYPSCALVKP